MSSTCSGLLHCASTLAITGAERDVLNLALAASQPRSSSFLQRAGRGYCRYCFFHDCFHYCLSKNKPLRLGFMRREAGPVALADTLAAIHTRTKHNSLLRQPSHTRPHKDQHLIMQAYKRKDEQSEIQREQVHASPAKVMYCNATEPRAKCCAKKEHGHEQTVEARGSKGIEAQHAALRDHLY